MKAAAGCPRGCGSVTVSFPESKVVLTALLKYWSPIAVLIPHESVFKMHHIRRFRIKKSSPVLSCTLEVSIQISFIELISVNHLCLLLRQFCKGPSWLDVLAVL